MAPAEEPLVVYCLRQGDRALVLSQRLAQWVTRAHELEEEMAIANIGLDLLGQARVLYTHAGELEGRGRTEDDFAYRRSAGEFLSPLLLEQPDADFAWVMVRQFLHDAWALPYWSALRASRDATLAGLAGKAARETAYHLRHARSWVVRLGDGTEESHRRTQAAVDGLWSFTEELLETDEVEEALAADGLVVDPASLRPDWSKQVDTTFLEAGLARPEVSTSPGSGRRGVHGPDFAQLIDELQVVSRAHPGVSW